MKKVMVVVLLAAICSTHLFAAGAAEREWPARPVTVIVPYSAGGGTDRMARTITPFLEAELGTSVVVQNIAGAAGEIGMAAMNDADPDGYTLGLLGFPDQYTMAAYKDVAFDNSKFLYLASFTETPTLIAVGPNSPFQSLDELVAHARRNPGAVTVSESGDSHLITTVLFEEAANISLTNVNYDGAGENLAAVLGGHVDAGALAVLFANELQDQNARILAVAASQRVPNLPDVPTFRELGYDVHAISSRVLSTPVGTPESVVAKLREALDRAGQSQELQQAIARGGEVYAYRSGEELQQFAAEVRDRLVRLITENIDKFAR